MPVFNTLPLDSPFSTPVYHAVMLDSTMDAARSLAEEGATSGTVVCADYQKKGRGRFARSWEGAAAEGLPFTILFHYERMENLPEVFTLRAGLAVSAACDKFISPHRTQIKWPNDIFAEGKKISGILTECVSGGYLLAGMESAAPVTVYIGIGVNVLQKTFPETFRAVSITQLAGGSFLKTGGIIDLRFTLLQEILNELYLELNDAARIKSWRERLNKKLYLIGERINFVPAGSCEAISCVIKGIGADGSLLTESAGVEKKFIAGEIRL